MTAGDLGPPFLLSRPEISCKKRNSEIVLENPGAGTPDADLGRQCEPFSS